MVWIVSVPGICGVDVAVVGVGIGAADVVGVGAGAGAGGSRGVLMVMVLAAVKMVAGGACLHAGVRAVLGGHTAVASVASHYAGVMRHACGLEVPREAGVEKCRSARGWVGTAAAVGV